MTPASKLQPVTLEGEAVVLKPLQIEHADQIAQAVLDGELYQLFFTFVPLPEEALAYVQTALAMQEQEGALVFAIFDKADKLLIGSTRFFRWEPLHLRVEIGHTWLRKSYQQSFYNLECKLLLLEHAFEKLALNAVEFRTDLFNFSSQRAIEKLGAKKDGILRNHMIMKNGRVRDTVVYSILKNEWPGVKENIRFRKDRSLQGRGS